MDQKEFQSGVIESLASLNKGQEEIVRRLDRGENTFEKLFKKVEENKDALTQHANSCPLKNDLDGLKRDIDRGNHPGSNEVKERVSRLESGCTSSMAEKNLKQRIFEIAKPAIWVLIGLFFSLILLHANSLFKVKADKVGPAAAAEQNRE